MEDFVAALLQCSGHFVEKNIVERGPTEVLELDIVATHYSDGTPFRKLFEVKSGKWGFADVFKLLGWKTYLSSNLIDAAYFVGTHEGVDKSVDFMVPKFEELGVTLISVQDHEGVSPAFTDRGLSTKPENEADHVLWRFSLWLERAFFEKARTYRNSSPDLKGPSEALAYLDHINNGIFFIGDLRERLSALYDAYLQHPKLSQAIASELDGHCYDPYSPKSSDSWQDALYNGKHDIVQAAMFYEHKARLAILKGAVDYSCLEQAGKLRAEHTISIEGATVTLTELPKNFYKAVEALKKLEDKEKVPALWQSFLWKWGGFFLTEKEDEERTTLASEIGIAEETLVEALSIYDILFPIEGGWFATLPASKPSTRIIKLFPCPFRAYPKNR